MLLSQQLDLRRKGEELSLQLYEKGTEVSILDSGVWQVYRGVIQLSRVQLDGTEIVLGWVTANGIFSNGLDSSSVPYRAIAISDVYIKRYSLQDITRYPQLGRQFLAQFSDRLIKSEQLLAIIAIKRVEDRLREFLLMLKQEMGQNVSDGVRLQARFTHQQLAEAICTTRVTVTRILGDFQNQGWVYFDSDRHIIIKEIEE